eukprot:TRINITY_DN15375_c0_g1_i1.p1 TRINITY_DN15375_c0_g1~~TRINITY_DN15375_c0_g1_i1.p1  ORF type:complete len:1287 (+),score=434.24 TRINITY_DN15375_c0_g1_i1:98-3862(+)
MESTPSARSFLQSDEQRVGRQRSRMLSARAAVLADLAVSRQGSTSPGGWGKSPQSGAGSSLFVSDPQQHRPSRSRLLDNFKYIERQRSEMVPTPSDEEPPPPQIWFGDAHIGGPGPVSPRSPSDAGALGREGEEELLQLLAEIDPENFTERIATQQEIINVKNRELLTASNRLDALKAKHQQIEQRLTRELEEQKEAAIDIKIRYEKLQKDFEEVQRKVTAAQAVIAHQVAQPVSPPLHPMHATDSTSPKRIQQVIAVTPFGQAPKQVAPQAREPQKESLETIALRKRLAVQQELMDEQMKELGKLRQFYQAHKGGKSGLYSLGRRIIMKVREFRYSMTNIKAAVQSNTEVLFNRCKELFAQVLKKLPPPPIGGVQVAALAACAEQLHEQLSALRTEHGVPGGALKHDCLPLQGVLSSQDAWEPVGMMAVVGQYNTCMKFFTPIPEMTKDISAHFGQVVDSYQRRLEDNEQQMQEQREAASQRAAQFAAAAVAARTAAERACDLVRLSEGRRAQIKWGESPETGPVAPLERIMVKEQLDRTVAVLDALPTCITNIAEYFAESDGIHIKEKLALRKEVAAAGARTAQASIALRSATADLALASGVDDPWYGGPRQDVAPVDPERDPQTVEYVNLDAPDGNDPEHEHLRAVQVDRSANLTMRMVEVLGELQTHWVASEGAHTQQKQELRAELHRLEELAQAIEEGFGNSVAALCAAILPVRESLETLCGEASLPSDPKNPGASPPGADAAPPTVRIGFLRRTKGASEFVGRILEEIDAPRRRQQLDKAIALLAAFSPVHAALGEHWANTQGDARRLQEELRLAQEQEQRAQEWLEILQEELDTTKAQNEEFMQRAEDLMEEIAAVKRQAAEREAALLEGKPELGFEKTIETLFDRCDRAEMTPRERKEVSKLLVQVKDLALEAENESGWQAMAAMVSPREQIRVTHQPMLIASEPAGGETGGLDSLARPPREILDRMVYCHRCGAGPHGPPMKKCSGCRTWLHYGIQAGAKMGTKTARIWQDQIAGWLERRKRLLERQRTLLRRVSDLLQGAEDRRDGQEKAQEPRLPAYVHLDDSGTQDNWVSPAAKKSPPTIVRLNVPLHSLPQRQGPPSPPVRRAHPASADAAERRRPTVQAALLLSELQLARRAEDCDVAAWTPQPPADQPQEQPRTRAGRPASAAVVPLSYRLPRVPSAAATRAGSGGGGGATPPRSRPEGSTLAQLAATQQRHLALVQQSQERAYGPPLRARPATAGHAY